MPGVRLLEEIRSICPQLLVEGFGRGAKEVSNFGVERCDGLRHIICLQEKAVEGTSSKTIGVVAKSKTDIEVVVHQLAKLLGLAAETVINPRLLSTALQTQDIIESAHAMQDERYPMTFAQLYLSFEGGELESVRSVAKAVESAFTNEHNGRSKRDSALFVKRPFHTR